MAYSAHIAGAFLRCGPICPVINRRQIGDGVRGLAAGAMWIEAHRQLCEARFAALENVIGDLKQEENDGQPG